MKVVPLEVNTSDILEFCEPISKNLGEGHRVSNYPTTPFPGEGVPKYPTFPKEVAFIQIFIKVHKLLCYSCRKNGSDVSFH